MKSNRDSGSYDDDNTPPPSPIDNAIARRDSSPAPYRGGLPSITEHVATPQPELHACQRIGFGTSISFKGNPKSPGKKRHSKGDISPPPPTRFQRHVSFDTFPGAESTENNTSSLTLNAIHKGYRYTRGSRTLMVGIGENEYSDEAFRWMLDELVDDGDEIVCLRVLDRESKLAMGNSVKKKQYLKEATELLEIIQAKNDGNKAIRIVLEFAIGKVHTTFTQMMKLYQPAMLIVGSRGRPLEGLQSLVRNRRSFSKWCLQYSPVPVVVVKPPEQREKKKAKRLADSARGDYARILRDSGIEEHETSDGSRHNSVFEVPNAPEVEAHAVAVAMGLPSRFDPMSRPYRDKGPKRIYSDSTTSTLGAKAPTSDDPQNPEVMIRSPKSESNGSGDEDSESEEVEIDDDERKSKLHDMEMEEAAALVKAENRRLAKVKEKGKGVGMGDSAVSLRSAEEEEEEEEEKESPRLERHRTPAPTPAGTEEGEGEATPTRKRKESSDETVKVGAEGGGDSTPTPKEKRKEGSDGTIKPGDNSTGEGAGKSDENSKVQAK